VFCRGFYWMVGVWPFQAAFDVIRKRKGSLKRLISHFQAAF